MKFSAVGSMLTMSYVLYNKLELIPFNNSWLKYFSILITIEYINNKNDNIIISCNIPMLKPMIRTMIYNTSNNNENNNQKIYENEWHCEETFDLNILEFKDCVYNVYLVPHIIISDYLNISMYTSSKDSSNINSTLT